jgi:hypothetical protein
MLTMEPEPSYVEITPGVEEGEFVCGINAVERVKEALPLVAG